MVADRTRTTGAGPEGRRGPPHGAFLSAASSWEIALKYQLGKLPLPEPPVEYVPRRVLAIGARSLAVEHSHALWVAKLPALHRDPFDRLLVAQALLLGLTIMTADPAVAQYQVPCLVV
ncbi:MAG: type II toxin-antitoxin system VapC family toxin [Acidimicrobiales bacterium]